MGPEVITIEEKGKRITSLNGPTSQCPGSQSTAWEEPTRKMARKRLDNILDKSMASNIY